MQIIAFLNILILNKISQFLILQLKFHIIQIISNSKILALKRKNNSQSSNNNNNKLTEQNKIRRRKIVLHQYFKFCQKLQSKERKKVKGKTRKHKN